MLGVAAAMGALTLLWLGPGYAVLRILGVRGLVAWACAPGITAGLVACATTVFFALDIRWTMLTAGVALVAVLAVLAGARRWSPRRYRVRVALRPIPAAIRWWTVIGCTVAGLGVVLAFALSVPDVAAPNQVRDALVHLNAIEWIRTTGDASMFGGIDPVVAHAGAGAFYPTVWHAVVALIPMGSTGLLANSAVLVVAVVLWPLTMVLLARVAFEGQPVVAAICGALTAALSFFPFTQSTLSAQWPNALGTALLPAALAMTVLAVRGRGNRGTWMVAIGAVAGAACAHPNTIFSYVALILPFALVHAWRWINRVVQGSGGTCTRRRVVLTSGGSVLAVACVGMVLWVGPLGRVLAGVLGYHQTIATRSYGYTVLRLLSDTGLRPVPGNLVVSVTVLVGVCVLRRRRQARWIVAMWLVTIVLAALAGGPEGPQRAITGFWYKHVFRLEALYPISTLLLAAIGIMAVGQWWSRRRLSGGRRPRRSRWWPAGAISVFAIMVFLAVQVPAMVSRGSGVYRPADIAARGGMVVVDQDDRRMLARLSQYVPDGTAVIADPNSGGVLASSYGGVEAVFFRLGTTALAPSQALLADRFSELGTSADVCHALSDLRVGFAYLDSELAPGGVRSAQSTPGISDAAGSNGLDPVATEGSVTLYRISACGGTPGQD